MRYSLTIDGVRCIELQCEVFLNVMYRETKYVIDKQWNMNIITHQPQDSVFGTILNTRFDQPVNPSTAS